MREPNHCLPRETLKTVATGTEGRGGEEGDVKLMHEGAVRRSQNLNFLGVVASGSIWSESQSSDEIRRTGKA